MVRLRSRDPVTGLVSNSPRRIQDLANGVHYGDSMQREPIRGSGGTAPAAGGPEAQPLWGSEGEAHPKLKAFLYKLIY